MSKPDEIDIRVDGTAPTSGNVLPLLHEIRHALVALLDSGQTTVIDLQRLPFSPADESTLWEILGQGEVTAQLIAFGRSLIRETRYPGVWRIEYLDAADRPGSRFIEIAFIPALLKAQPEDIRTGLVQLSDRLAGGDQD